MCVACGGFLYLLGCLALLNLNDLHNADCGECGGLITIETWEDENVQWKRGSDGDAKEKKAFGHHIKDGRD